MIELKARKLLAAKHKHIKDAQKRLLKRSASTIGIEIKNWDVIQNSKITPNEIYN